MVTSYKCLIVFNVQIINHKEKLNNLVLNKNKNYYRRDLNLGPKISVPALYPLNYLSSYIYVGSLPILSISFGVSEAIQPLN